VPMLMKMTKTMMTGIRSLKYVNSLSALVTNKLMGFIHSQHHEEGAARVGDTKMQLEAEEEDRSEFHLQIMMLLLINKQLTSFHFPPGLYSDMEDCANRIWKTLLYRQPSDIHTIVCMCEQYARSWNVRPFFKSLVPVFPKLEVFQLQNLKCSDQDLIKISKKLPKLRSVPFFKLNDNFH
jgi:hypothetical protein